MSNTRRADRWALLAFAIVGCGCLLLTAIGRAQSGIDPNIDPYYDPQAVISDVPMQVDDDAVNIHAELERQRREKWDLENLDWFEDHGFAAWVSYDAPFVNYKDVTFRATQAEYYPTSRDTVYEMGNQPPYDVQMGSVSLNFRGAVVRMTEGGNATGQSCDGLFNYLHAYSGWATSVTRFPEDEPQDGVVVYHHAWLKGYLTRTVVEVNTGAVDNCGLRNGDYVYRYEYHSPSGRVITFHQAPAEVASISTWSQGPCNSRVEIPGPEPTSYWSDEGSASLDTSNACRLKIKWADGALEEFHHADTDEFPVAVVGSGIARWADPGATCGSLHPLHTTDRNGNITTYTFTSTSQSAIDPRGRETKVTFSPGTAPGFLRLQTVDLPAPGGGTPLRYTINWQQPMQVPFGGPNAIWPDVQCHSGGLLSISCGTSRLDLVDSITNPDGRSYRFTYTPWGGLDTVTEPGGAVRRYSYGDATNTTYAQNTIPLVNRLDSWISCGALWTGEMAKVQARGLTSQSVYPQGLSSGQVETTTISYEKVDLGGCAPDLLGAATTGPDACTQVWKVITRPDGSLQKIGTAVRSMHHYVNRPPLSSGPPSPHGRDIGQEVWAPGGTSLITSNYNGDRTTGELFYDFATPVVLRMSEAPEVDLRTKRTRGTRDGVSFTTTFSYDDTLDIDPGGGVTLRNTKNVTAQCTWSGEGRNCNQGQGTKLVETDTRYFHQDHPEYITQGILHLPGSQTLIDPLRGVLKRTDYNYDQFSLGLSGAPNLDTTIGSIRGNETTVTSYKNPVSATGPVSSQTHYFDNGITQQSVDRNGNQTNMTYDFGACSPGHQILINTVNSPTVFVNGNNINLVTTTVADCSSSLTLRVTDPNNNSTYTQYDNLGRIVEVAGPGSTLNQIGLRDPSAPMNTTGNAWQGPSSWTQYFDLGIINHQRVVTHTKDGTADGRYVKTFTDGLGRTIQTRAEIDPGFSQGFVESVTTTQYDNMGRVSKSFVPIFAVANDSYIFDPNGLGTVTQYETLGRVKSVQPPGLPASTVSYDSSAGLFRTTATDAKLNQTITLTDVLGHVAQVAMQADKPGDPPCSFPGLGSWCVTVTDYDAAGRLLQTTDPANNHIVFVYDGLRRKIEMTDPDMGHWLYEYDNNDNLTRQTDAKGQVILMYYDALDRIKRKDLPPNGSTGAEDITYFYDGETAP